MKEKYQSNSWKCLDNDTTASIFRRRSVEFIATASLATKHSAQQEQKLSRESESRRQLYMFRKVNGNPLECSMTSGPGSQGAHSNGSTFCDG